MKRELPDDIYVGPVYLGDNVNKHCSATDHPASAPGRKKRLHNFTRQIQRARALALAMDLLLLTAQRRSDIIRMGWQHVRGVFLTITQQKTGTEVSIPVIGRFADVLASAKRENLTFLMTAYGAPFTEAGFTNWFRDMVKEAGLPLGLSPHGLRKAACVRLADAGRSATDIMSIRVIAT